MKLNSNTVIRGSLVTLVPYKHHHVLTYHQWMKDPFLLEMTASEPLSLEEEYNMQQSWAADESKLTFIILSNNQPPNVPGTTSTSIQQTSILEQDPESARLLAAETARYGPMVGDVNLYFTDFEDPRGKPEIEVMIAVPTSRRRGLGTESLRLVMEYAASHLKSIHTFVAKISLGNDASLRLFQATLGFVVVSQSHVFGEATLEKAVDGLGAGQTTRLLVLEEEYDALLRNDDANNSISEGVSPEPIKLEETF